MNTDINTEKKKSNKTRNLLIFAGVVFTLCCICPAMFSMGQQAGIFPTSAPMESSISEEPTPQPLSEATEIIVTDVPAATDTPLPTDIPTEAPQPITLKGNGDDVVDVDKWDGPALLQIKYTGSRNFIVENFDANGEQIDLLVNKIGAYQGTLPIDFLVGENTTRLQIGASGPWEINVLPLAQIRKETIPGTFTGTGDDVIFLDGGAPDLLKADASAASRNFVVYSYGDDIDLLINEIAPYTGTTILKNDTVILSIQATGPWSIEVTVK